MLDLSLNRKQMERGELGLFLFVLWVWSRDALRSFIYAFMHIITSADFASSFLTGMDIVLCVVALPYILKHIHANDFIYLLLFIAIFIFSVLSSLNSGHDFLIDSADRIFLLCLPLYLLGVTVKADKYSNWLYLFSLLCLVAHTLFIYLFHDNERFMGGVSRSMVGAYAILPYVCLVWYFALKRGGVLRYLLSIFTTILLLSMGTRGPVFCLLAFFVLYIFFLAEKKKSYLALIGIIVIVIAINLFGDQIFSFLSSLFGQFGMSSRALDYFVEGGTDITESSDNERRWIIAEIMKVVNDNPLAFRGFAADRLDEIAYAHNVIFEFLISYGVIIGPVLFVSLVILFYKGLKSSSCIFNKAFLSILICCYFVKLFMSGSYIDSPGFYLLVGYSVQQVRTHKERKMQVVRIKPGTQTMQ